MRNKWTINSVRTFYEDNGCKLLDTEYKTKKTKYTFICSCGNRHTNTFDDFYNGKRRCTACRYKSSSESNKNIGEEEAIKAVESVNGKFISFYRKILSGRNIVYVKYICSKGHENDVYYGSLTQKHGCKLCAVEEAKKRYKKTIDEVKEELSQYGLVLTSLTYTNMDSPITYRCTCGEEHTGYLGAIRKGIRGGCRLLKGENHPNWNHSLNKEERLNSRHYPEYYSWVKLVYERDNYTCQKCFNKGGVLNAHHILSYSKHPDFRVSLNNGITLCESCHKNFHNVYGYTNFTEENLKYYLLEEKKNGK